MQAEIMKRILPIILLPVVIMTACSYDESIDVVAVSVRLGFPDTYDGTKGGLRVEMQDATASVFVDSTDNGGEAHFTVPSGLYTVRSSAQTRTYDYRYFFNGTRDRVVIASDSAHVVDLPLTMSRRRIVH